MLDLSSAVLYLTLLTLYLIAFVGYAYEEVDGEGEGEDGTWLSLWSNDKPRRNQVGVLPDRVFRVRDTNRSNMKRISSTAKKLFHSAMGKIRKPAPAPLPSGRSGLGWEIDVSELQSHATTPILCFVNSKSGGQQGLSVFRQLCALLSRQQVFDLAKTSPRRILQEYAKLPQCIVLIAGGDGTVNWVLDSMDGLTFPLPPRVCVLPIGTGNDLANHLGWLDYFEDHAVSSRVLLDIIHSNHAYVDRYAVKFPKGEKKFTNYLGVGLDASIVRQFHTLRKHRPNMFIHKYINKFFYGVLGFKEMWRGERDLVETFRREVDLFCEGKRVPLPEDTQGIVLVNIASYAGGSVLWSPEGEETALSSPLSSPTPSPSPSYTPFNGPPSFQPQSAGDGLIEVVAVKSSFELAQVKLGLAHCTALCQGSRVEIVVRRGGHSLPVQLDGEPYELEDYVGRESSARIEISVGERVAMLLAPEMAIGRVGLEREREESELQSLLVWAREEGIVTESQRQRLLAEQARRKSLLKPPLGEEDEEADAIQ